MTKRTYETTEYAAMMGRMLKAYGKRVGDADVEDLAEMIELHAAFGEHVKAAVAAQREAHGRSWADIAKATGTSRQAVQMRYGK